MSTAPAAAPKVSFLIPCYKLAHFLEECVGSMLRQTYTDFEIVILDDCSPDNTEEVARRITDPRVRYVRHEQNIGHLRNYNYGIGVGRGEYLWLISADDNLKDPTLLARYVEVLDRHPRVGYIFSPAIALQDGVERGVMEWTRYSRRDLVMPAGGQFFRDIINGNRVAAPTGLVRKAAYDKCGLFSLDLPHTGDWFLWSLIALHFDVAFQAEPMVYYRTHGENMSIALRRNKSRLVRDNLDLARWKLRAVVEAERNIPLLHACDEMLGNRYANEIAQTVYHEDPLGPTLETIEAAIDKNVPDPQERARIRVTLYAALGDQAFQVARIDDARRFYGKSLELQPGQSMLRAKRMMLRFGKLGLAARGAVGKARSLLRAG
jgi:glycosyltransferase involved in cell wall biosynthesis